MWGKLSRLIALVGLLLPGLSAGAEGPPPAGAEAIEEVITRQIEAFRRDDGGAAFDFATPELQAMFGDATRFMGMVKGMYPSVYRPKSFAFGPLATVDGAVVQEVGLIGPDGQPQTALYTMERQADGSWKIAACRLVVRATVES